MNIIVIAAFFLYLQAEFFDKYKVCLFFLLCFFLFLGLFRFGTFGLSSFIVGRRVDGAAYV